MLKINLARRLATPLPEYKECSYCGGEIVKLATKCKYCQSSLGKMARFWEHAKPPFYLCSFVLAWGLLFLLILQLRAIYRVLDLRDKRQSIEKSIAELEKQKKVIEEDIIRLNTSLRRYSEAMRKASNKGYANSMGTGGVAHPKMPSLPAELKDIIKKYESTISDSTNE